MFKIFKYLFIANLFIKTKKSILTIGSMLLLLVISAFLMNDLIVVARGSEKYLFLSIKWVLILIFIVITAYNLLKVFNVATDSVRIKPKHSVVHRDDKKDRILAKEHLQSRRDLIMEKHMKARS